MMEENAMPGTSEVFYGSGNVSADMGHLNAEGKLH